MAPSVLIGHQAGTRKFLAVQGVEQADARAADADDLDGARPSGFEFRCRSFNVGFHGD